MGRVQEVDRSASFFLLSCSGLGFQYLPLLLFLPVIFVDIEPFYPSLSLCPSPCLSEGTRRNTVVSRLLYSFDPSGARSEIPALHKELNHLQVCSKQLLCLRTCLSFCMCMYMPGHRYIHMYIYIYIYV